MKRTLRILLGVVIGLCVLTAGAWVLTRTLGDRPALYEGKTIDYWSTELTNRDAAASNRAAAIVSSQIIPSLTNQIVSDTHDSKIKKAIIDELNNLPGVQIEYLEADQRRAQALIDLASFGTRAQVAKPVLLELQKDHKSKLSKMLPTALRKIDGEVSKAPEPKPPKKQAEKKQAKNPATPEPPKQPAAPEPPKNAPDTK